MSAYRVEVNGRSFDLSKRTGTYAKTGEPIWQTLGYFRTRRALERFMRDEGIPPSVLDGLPQHHPDIVAARGRFVQSVIEGERVAAAISERVRRNLLAKGTLRAL